MKAKARGAFRQWRYIRNMSERSELLKAMAAAYALGDRAIPYRQEQRSNPALSELDEPAQALARLARYAATHPDDPRSAEIHQAYTLLAKLLAAPHDRQA